MLHDCYSFNFSLCFVWMRKQAPYETFQGALAATGEYTSEGSTARPSSNNLRASMDDGLLLPPSSGQDSLLDDSALEESFEATKVRS